MPLGYEWNRWQADWLIRPCRPARKPGGLEKISNPLAILKKRGWHRFNGDLSGFSGLKRVLILITNNN
ncbi:hypothetical protein [Methylomagnum ishizawai]|uniref:hypothetical protein n=1 Tax=Methylomagnum ishizawai TaxID=1760988 RepID=UPI000F7362D9|nr:hypothetical protein [Methylomagnum ishizawai]